MTLFRRGKVWWSYVWVRGVRYGKSTKTSNRRLAEEVDREHKHELTFVREQAPQLKPDMRFEELVARFLANAGPKAWHLDRLKMLLPFFADYPIGHMKKNLAREYRQWRHRQKKLTDTTINRDLECLRHILFWAVDEGLLLVNPLSRMRLERERKRKRPVVSLGEEDLLLRAAAPHLRPILIAAFDAGMRRREILTQLMEDVDFPRQLLFVTHSKTPEGEAREIPLTERLFRLLSEMRNAKAHGLIFTFENKPIHSVKTAWKAAARRSGIRPCRFHDLRHTFNSRLLEAGVMREVRMTLMGHSLGEDPQATYTHIELPQKREAIRKLELWRAEQEKQLKHETKEKGGTRNGSTEPASGASGSAEDGSLGNGRSGASV
jgi:integrase